MEPKEFDELTEQVIERIRKVQTAKNAEYASVDDRLHNFKRAGAMRQVIPEEALIGMWTKHIISILDIVDKLNVENKGVGLSFIVSPVHLGIPKAMIEEKVGDAIIYLILLEALLKERINND